MTKYRKLPIEVEAFQWWPHEGQQGAPVFDEMHPNCHLDEEIEAAKGAPIGDDWHWAGRHYFFIKSLEGDMHIAPGYYIVKGPHEGEWWGVRPDIFEETYERV